MNKLIPFLIMLTACSPSKQNAEKNEKTLPHPLQGEWRNVTLRIEIDKKQGEPSSVLELDEFTWEEKLQIRPIRTYFRDDGTFNSEHFNLKDSLVLNPEGTWSATASEIAMITQRPFTDTTSCTYSLEGDVVTFGCWVDWDQDGEKDDWYLGTQKKY